MTATAHLEHEPPAPSPPAGPGTPVFEVCDLVEDPRTDVEALCLCALLWAPRPGRGDRHRAAAGAARRA